MGRHNQYECRWSFRHVRNGEIIFEFKDKQNILVDEGEKAMVDSFFRKNAANYFPAGDLFYVGLYKGTITEETTLSSIPVFLHWSRMKVTGEWFQRKSLLLLLVAILGL